MTGLPGPRFDHLRRLSDDVGLHEHARGGEPAHEFGYCVDDVARGLVLTQHDGVRDDRTLDDLRHTWLAFVLDAVTGDGTCHNRRSPEGVWTDRPSLGDWWGRAAWALGLAAATLSGREAAAAEHAFSTLATRRSPHRRSLAYAALGAAELAGREDARSLLADAATAVASHPGREASPWVWPEPRLAYDNASLPWALLRAGEVLGRQEWVDRGLEWLDFLVERQTGDGHLSVVPSGGWGPGDGPVGFDQQPLELASLAGASAVAHRLTDDGRWTRVVHLAAEWFVGNNDRRVRMTDPETGAGHDGLTPSGRNLNCGAESTLAANLTLAAAHTRGVSECSPSCPSIPTSTSTPTPTG